MNFENIVDILRENVKNVKNTKRIIEINIYDALNSQALNYILAEDIYSPINVPELRTSMRDGYAIYFSLENENNSEFIINNFSYAGNEEIKQQITSGNSNVCSYIATGGVLPENTNCVIMVEDIIKKDNKIFIKNPELLKENQWIRQIGSDIEREKLVLEKNTFLNETCIATLCSIGIYLVKVFEKIKIGILSSGDEIVDIEHTTANIKEKHQVYDSNRPMLMSYLKNNNMDIEDFGILNDNYENTKRTMQYILKEVDVLITSGGISMGEKDYIKPVLKELGNVLIEKTMMKPGKPLLFTVIDDPENQKTKYIFSLPGNPVSAGVTFLLFVQPFLNALSGKEFALPTKIKAISKVDLESDKTRVEFIRGKLYSSFKYGKFFVELTTDNHNSSNISSMNEANCLIEMLPNNSLKKGNYVNVYLIGQLYQAKEWLNIGILTASDRAYAKIYSDKSGEEISKYITANVQSKYNINYVLVADEEHLIKKELKNLADNLCCNLILTTGGTGPAMRDVTDIATRAVCDKLLPGFGEIIRNKNFAHVPTSILSAQVAGIRYIHEDIGSLIINLPGKPDAIKECLDIVFNIIPKCLQIINAAELIIRR